MNHVVRALQRQHLGADDLPTDPTQTIALHFELPADEYPG